MMALRILEWVVKEYYFLTNTKGVPTIHYYKPKKKREKEFTLLSTKHLEKE